MAANDSLNVAVIDIGSNSLRLQVSEVKDKSYKVLDDYKEMLRLGDSIYTAGYFAPEVIDRIVETLNGVKKLAESRGCETIRAVATAAFREADNLGETLIRIQDECGLNVEVISGEEEARLTYLAATANFELSGRKAVVVDIGGGSTEYTIISDGKTEKSTSLPLGCNRLMREFFETDPPTSAMILRMKEHIINTQKAVGLDRDVDMVICTGGSMNNVAVVKHYKDKVVRASNVKYVERSFLKKFIKDFSQKSYRDRVKTEGLEENRGDLILPAAIQTDMVLNETGASGFYTLSGGLRSGLTIDTINKMGIELPFQNNMENIRYSRLMEIGNKFEFDESGAVHVRNLAKMLFDGMRGELSLCDRDWTLLEAAALLRDVGKHISYSKHHKHSYYLIKHSELVGYCVKEVEMIALIARYHRKGAPKQSHVEYTGLTEQEQEKVLKLAALLRVAIALDRSHKGYIKNVRVDVKHDAVVLTAKSKGDIAMEIRDFELKKDLINKILKKPVVLI
jgi:exopolyphosphatase/guanosine-5'-triphosphate,3'-diphosphate pyrophosphatase